jgi:ABC-type uncharacterized transport system substrate-binding protein
LIEYLETPNVEINREGILAGFEKAGLKRGRDFELRVRNAQGDMTTLNTIVDASVAEGADILLTAATPALQAALRRANGRTVVSRSSPTRWWPARAKALPTTCHSLPAPTSPRRTRRV